MSRRKDRERFMALKGQNADYVGFRGSSTGSASEQPALEAITCTRCGRKRNVPAVATASKEDFVCATCQEELKGEAQGSDLPEDAGGADEGLKEP